MTDNAGERYGPEWQKLAESELAWKESERRRKQGVMVHRVQCACITHGCLSALVWEDTSHQVDERLLHLNGWRLDYGRWICGNHE